MTKNQFFYQRRQELPIQIEGQETKFKEFRDSFNIEKVVRTLEMDDGGLLILLDDLHQRLQEVPVYNKQGKQTATRKEMNTFQSEITLLKEDVERFYDITAIYSKTVKL